MRYHDGRPPGLIITPATHPDRFTQEERDLFEQGKCGQVVEYGNGRGVIHCKKDSAPKADFGSCQRHARQLIDEGPAATNWSHGWNGQIQ